MAKTIENGLVETIAAPNLGIISDYLELSLDELAKNDAVSKLPVVGSIISIGKTAVAIRDWIFVKNIFDFLTGLNSIDSKKRKKWLDNLNDKNFTQRVGFEVLSIIDKMKDKQKNNLAGKIFGAYIDERINYEDFLRLCEKLERLFISDLNNLKSGLPDSEDEKERYRSIGLYSAGRNGVPDPEYVAKFIINTGIELVPNNDLILLKEFIITE